MVDGGVQKPLYNWSTTPMPHKINKRFLIIKIYV